MAESDITPWRTCRGSRRQQSDLGLLVYSFTSFLMIASLSSSGGRFRLSGCGQRLYRYCDPAAEGRTNRERLSEFSDDRSMGSVIHFLAAASVVFDLPEPGYPMATISLFDMPFFTGTCHVPC